MSRLGMLRNFRRKLYAKYIEPNLGNPAKLARIPKQYRTILRNQDDWNNFVTYTQSENFKDVSKKTIIARSKSIYDHRMGRGGYTSLREKLMEHEKQIKDGELKLDPGVDAMTLVFGKENGGFLKGVGMGVTSTIYFHIPRTKGSSKEEIVNLKFALQNERRELQKKDEELKALSTKVTKQDETLNLVLAHLASQGMKLSNLESSTTLSPTEVISMEKNVGCNDIADTITSNTHTQKPITPAIPKTTGKTVESKTTIPETPSHSPKAVTQEIAKTTKKMVESKSATTDSQQKKKDTTSPQVLKSIKCSLSYPQPRNIVALGTVYLSSERQNIHGAPLQDDCYRVSIDEVKKGAAFLPHETGEYKTVEQAHGTFVAWPKFLVKCDSKVPHMKSTQDSELQNSKKRKNIFCTKEDIVKNTRSTINKTRNN